MTAEMEALHMEYGQLLNMQQFDPALLDYSLLDNHCSFLERLAKVENSAVSLFDMYQKKHVFASCNFTTLFGYDEDGLAAMTTEYFDSRIHPEDFIKLTRNGIKTFKYMFTLPPEERSNYKMITEFRVRNGADEYVRVIEQHQTLETDPLNNIWLSLSVMDLSPNQNGAQDVTAQIINFKTGNSIGIDTIAEKQQEGSKMLSPRQKEILAMVKEGLLSKEISDRLSISVHTVNTHRQRILEKLGADNSMEAVRYARGLGLAHSNG